MTEFAYCARDEADTDRLGAALAAALPDGSVVALIGSLGAGKTRLVQAVAKANDVDVRTVLSPTFVLVNEYAGRRPIYHFDVYRVNDEDEFLELGPDEYFQRNGLVFVEWADRVETCLPDELLTIDILVGEGDERTFRVRGEGEAYECVVSNLAKHLATDPP